MRRLSEADLQTWMRAGVPIGGRSDGNGLTFTLSANQVAAWVLRYSLGGKRRELTIGRYPSISLEQTRDLAAQACSMIALGHDVAAAKQSEKRRQNQESRKAGIQCAPVTSVDDAASPSPIPT